MKCKNANHGAILPAIAMTLAIILIMAIGYVLITRFYEVVLPEQPFFMMMAVLGFGGICILAILKAIFSR